MAKVICPSQESLPFIRSLPVLMCQVDSNGAIIWATDTFMDVFVKDAQGDNLSFNDIFLLNPFSFDSVPEGGTFLLDAELFNEPSGKAFYCLTIQRLKGTDKPLFFVVANDQTELKREQLAKQLLINLVQVEKETPDLAEFFNAIQNELQRIMDAQNFFVVLWDKLRRNLKIPFFRDQFDSFTEIPQGKTLSGYVIETGKSLLITKTDFDRLHREGEVDIVGTPCKAWMGVPLRNKTEVIGLMAVQSYTSERAYSRNDLKILEFISTQVALAIERKEYEINLKRAKSRAEEADRLKSAFLANMSHEIRTPMNSIIGFSELLIRKTISQEKKNLYAQYVTSSSKSLLNLIDDIIDIAKIEAGQLRISKSHTPINRVLQELNTLFQTQLDQKKSSLSIEIHSSINDPDFTVLCDSLRVKQILSNLLSNAIKFTKKGHVEFGYLIPNNATLLFYVHDTGIGLSPEKKDIIFEEFRQGDDSTTRQYGGTGLGLAISRKLVQLMGGRIWVESELGKGSTFYFTIPLIVSNRSKELYYETTEKPLTHSLEGKTILIAEDEDYNFFFLQEVLTPTRANILRAANGKEAVELVRTNSSISIVLMDIQMPQLNGYLATQQIKLLKPNLPVVAQTAYAMAEERAKGLRAGCDEYLAKPIKPSDLLDVIRNLLS